MTPQLTIELAKAWAERAERLIQKLQHMEHGFALFRPEDIKRTYQEYNRAVAISRYWSVQA